MGDNNLQQIAKKDFEGLYVLNVDLGMLNYQKGDYKKALNYLQLAFKYSTELCLHLATNPNVKKTILDDLQKQLQDIKGKIIEICQKLADEEFNNKNYDSAIEYYQNILNYSSNNPTVYGKICRCLELMGAYASAVSFLEKASLLAPDQHDLYRQIGDFYDERLNNSFKAIEYYQKYVSVAPEDNIAAKVYNILGHLYETIGQYNDINKQIEYFEKSVKIAPEFKCAIKNLAIVYPRVGRDEDAIECYHKLFKLGATMDDYFDYAAIQIKLKNFKEGWKYYEYRFSKENNATVYPKINKPKWKGQNIQDKILLVQYEQGFGDSLMFFRYLELLKPLAKKVIFRSQNELVDFFKTNANGIEIVGMSTPIEKIHFDYHIPIMSLIHMLNLDIDNIPSTKSYLKADEEKVKKYKKEFFNNDCLKIGISWHGAVFGNARRNATVDCFYPLTKLKNTKVYSFQKGAGSEELENLPEDIEIIDLGKTFNNFADTAAAMQNIDLFITSDNALLNLSGAMGKKTYLLLSKDAEWRWFLEEEENPWYDSVRMFKKKDENDNWSLLIDKIIEILPKK